MVVGCGALGVIVTAEGSAYIDRLPAADLGTKALVPTYLVGLDQERFDRLAAKGALALLLLRILFV